MKKYKKAIISIFFIIATSLSFKVGTINSNSNHSDEVIYGQSYANEREFNATAVVETKDEEENENCDSKYTDESVFILFQHAETIHKDDIDSDTISEVELYYNVPLSEEIQGYVREIGSEFNIDERLILAIIKQESNFNSNLTHTNTNGTIDKGLMQLNSQYHKWQSELAGIDISTFNPFNYRHNIRAGVAVLAYYRDYWIERGIKEPLLENYMLNSYNMGQGGFNKYVRNTGKTTRSYDQKIKNYAQEIKNKHGE